MPDGNRLLLQRGALPLPYPFQTSIAQLPDWLKAHAPEQDYPSSQLSLF
jgi:hypothetical protein